MAKQLNGEKSSVVFAEDLSPEQREGMEEYLMNSAQPVQEDGRVAYWRWDSAAYLHDEKHGGDWRRKRRTFPEIPETKLHLYCDDADEVGSAVRFGRLKLKAKQKFSELEQQLAGDPKNLKVAKEAIAVCRWSLKDIPKALEISEAIFKFYPTDRGLGLSIAATLASLKRKDDFIQFLRDHAETLQYVKGTNFNFDVFAERLYKAMSEKS